jgi:hypothetical protein
MACQLYSCPFSDGFECFYTAEQCISPAVWEQLYYPSPGFPRQLGFCIVIDSIAKGYVNLSLYCRHNITRESISAFVSIRNDSNTITPDERMTTPIIAGIIAASVSLLLLCFTALYIYQRIKENRARRMILWRHEVRILP